MICNKVLVRNGFIIKVLLFVTLLILVSINFINDKNIFDLLYLISLLFLFVYYLIRNKL